MTTLSEDQKSRLRVLSVACDKLAVQLSGGTFPHSLGHARPFLGRDARGTPLPCCAMGHAMAMVGYLPNPDGGAASSSLAAIEELVGDAGLPFAGLPHLINHIDKVEVANDESKPGQERHLAVVPPLTALAKYLRDNLA
mgnify:CR=1 FL=1